MEKFISYEKLSKKKKRELDAKRRNTWGEVNPVTRKPANPKAYNRQKARKWSYDDSSPVLYCFYITTSPAESSVRLVHFNFG
jgi:hypothetical protein